MVASRRDVPARPSRFRDRARWSAPARDGRPFQVGQRYRRLWPPRCVLCGLRHASLHIWPGEVSPRSQYRRTPAEMGARRSSRCSAHIFFVAADSLSRPSWVLGPVETPQWIRQRPLYGSIPSHAAFARHACPSRQRAPHRGSSLLSTRLMGCSSPINRAHVKSFRSLYRALSDNRPDIAGVVSRYRSSPAIAFRLSMGTACCSHSRITEPHDPRAVGCATCRAGP
jgi:hypothetical protein